MEIPPPEQWSPKTRALAYGLIATQLLFAFMGILGLLAKLTGSEVFSHLIFLLLALWWTFCLIPGLYYYMNGCLKYIAIFFAIVILLLPIVIAIAK